eukprot:92254-Amphidinium_carterae.1
MPAGLASWMGVDASSSKPGFQGAVSDAVQSTCGFPPGCGLAVDLLHAFLVRTLQSAGRQREVRKCVDDMVLVAAGPYFAHYFQGSYSFTQANMQVNSKKTVVCNGTRTKQKLWKAWRAGCFPLSGSLLVTSALTLSGLPGEILQRKRLRTFEQSMTRVRALGLPVYVKARIVKSLHSVGLYGAEVGGIPAQGMAKLRASARRALGKGAGLCRSAPGKHGSCGTTPSRPEEVEGRYAISSRWPIV